jgi:hypothetical protein
MRFKLVFASGTYRAQWGGELGYALVVENKRHTLGVVGLDAQLDQLGKDRIDRWRWVEIGMTQEGVVDAHN